MSGEPLLIAQSCGLKCDTRGCGWVDMSITRAEYPLWVNCPCPLCDGNLLTEADYRVVRRIEFYVKWFNRLFFWWPRGRSIGYGVVDVGLDGSGKATFTQRATTENAVGISQSEMHQKGRV